MPGISVKSAQRERAFQAMLARWGGLFWDTDTEALDMSKNRNYIISRLLNLGGIAGLDWVEGHYSPEEIAEAVRRRRDLHPIVRNFMAERYHIPGEQLVSGPSWR